MNKVTRLQRVTQLVSKVEAFKTATEELQSEWARYSTEVGDHCGGVLASDYPKGLPSFDEFYVDVCQWSETSHLWLAMELANAIYATPTMDWEWVLIHPDNSHQPLPSLVEFLKTNQFPEDLEHEIRNLTPVDAPLPLGGGAFAEFGIYCRPRSGRKNDVHLSHAPIEDCHCLPCADAREKADELRRRKA